MSNQPAQLELFEPETPRAIEFEGRAKGALEVTHDDRLSEVARLASQGYKPGEIGSAMGLTTVRASELVKNARQLGLIDFFHEGRNQTTREMSERRTSVARRSFELLQKRLNYAYKKKAEDIDARDVDDAFKALDMTEHKFRESKGGNTVVQTTGPVAVFSAEDLQRAAGVSQRILAE